MITVFPGKCKGCGIRMERGVFCPTCSVEYARAVSEICVDCGKNMLECRCIPARIATAKLIGFSKLFFYDPSDTLSSTAHAIYMLKRGRSREVIKFFARRIAESLSASGIGGEEWAVAFVPRSRGAIIKYGYDHMEKLARIVADEIGSPLTRAIVRVGSTSEQKKLSAVGRAYAAANSYRIKDATDLGAKKIVLLDDVLTTGATLSNCLACLKRAGATKIFCAVIAETRRRRIINDNGEL